MQALYFMLCILGTFDTSTYGKKMPKTLFLLLCDGQTDGRTYPLLEMQERIDKRVVHLQVPPLFPKSFRLFCLMSGPRKLPRLILFSSQQIVMSKSMSVASH